MRTDHSCAAVVGSFFGARKGKHWRDRVFHKPEFLRPRSVSGFVDGIYADNVVSVFFERLRIGGCAGPLERMDGFSVSCDPDADGVLSGVIIRDLDIDPGRLPRVGAALYSRKQDFRRFDVRVYLLFCLRFVSGAVFGNDQEGVASVR